MSIFNFAGSSIFGQNYHLFQFSVFPTYIHFKVTFCTDSLHFTVFPSIRKGREQMNESHVTLHQHFGNAGCTTKVTVYLERGMCIPKVVQCSIFQNKGTCPPSRHRYHEHSDEAFFFLNFLLMVFCLFPFINKCE